MRTEHVITKLANYARKSSEDKERQVLSIPAQTEWAKEIAARFGTEIYETFTEERSAKMPYNRPSFDAMVTRIRKGEIDAIVCWKLDRLSRNPEEAGIILGMLKRGEIKQIITSDREYRPEDNAIISYVDFGMADQYVRDLSKNVKRGLKAKIEAGWRPSGAPLGYLNNLAKPQGERDLIPDPERFELVHRILKLFLSGDYSVRELRAETVKWGLKTRQTKRQGGKYLQISHIYRILTESFYYGYFWTNNSEAGQRELRKGSHKEMITEHEYDLIQAKLGRKGKPRSQKHHNLYTGKIQCGECSSMVTADENYQMICSACKLKFAYRRKNACPRCGIKIENMKKPVMLHYIYYRCTKKKDLTCSQRPLRVRDMEALINKALDDFNLSDVFSKWALEELARDNETAMQDQNAVIDSQQKRHKDVVAELHNLTRLYTSPRNVDGTLMSLEEYETDRGRLLAEKKQLEKEQSNTSRKIEEWMDWAVNSFDFATAARVRFELGPPQDKKSIFMSLSGSNLTLQDGKLSVSLKKPLDFYAIMATRFPTTKIRLGPRKFVTDKGEYLPFEADIPTLRGILNDVRTYFRTVKQHEPFPIFEATNGPTLEGDPLTS